MPAPLLQLQDVRLTFGGHPLLQGAELIVHEGDRIALVGRNGSGKSTLLKIAAGLVEADGGARSLSPAATIRYLPQEPDLSGHATVRDYAEAGLGPGDDPYRALYILNALGLTGDENPAALSGGQARRAALARAMAPAPDILLLDEPTNHLDLPAIEWLEDELKSTKSAFVLISHDRRFLQSLTRATVWLDRGRARRLSQGFSAFEAWRDQVLEEEESDRHKLDRRIAMEEDWVRYGVTARRKRNVGRMERLGQLRQQRREARRATGKANMIASDSEQSGALVIEAKGVSKSFGGPAIVQDVGLRIMRGDRLALVGPNGAGKTTLLNLLTGVLQPDAGALRIGANVQMQTLDQKRAILREDMTLTEFLTGGGGDNIVVNGQSRHVTGYMKDFLFGAEQARQPVRVLSGGERGRLMLAKALAAPANLLVLDEPTNDLDLETLDLLQETLADHPGTVIVVSHDRDFIDRVATSVLYAEGGGRFTEYAGGYSDMLAQRGAGLARPENLPSRQRGESRPQGDRVATPSSPSRKLSFKDKHALEKLPGEIEALQAELATLQTKIADPDLYARDRKTFDAVMARIAGLTAQIAQAEDKWLELETLRESFEG
jgi:ABC transport system ATP-binding/permease protein